MCRMFSEQNDENENHLLRRRLACTAYTSCTQERSGERSWIEDAQVRSRAVFETSCNS